MRITIVLFLLALVNPAWAETFPVNSDGTITCPDATTDTILWLGDDQFSACNDDWDFTGGQVTGTLVIPPPPPPPPPPSAIALLPDAHEWTDLGPVLETGPPGSSDAVFGGAAPCGLVKRDDGVFVLYYVGAGGLRPDGQPAYRQLHAATATDDLVFTKAPNNPILTYIDEPAAGATGETGIFSCAPMIDEAGIIWLYVSTLVEYTPGGVHGDIQLANCGLDGLTCGTQPNLVMIVNHGNPDYVGSYDETQALGAYCIVDGTCVLLMGPEVRPKWGLAWASGPSPMDMTASDWMVESRNTAHAGGDPIPLGDGNMAIFVLNKPRGDVHVRAFPEDDPGAVSGVQKTYNWSDSDDPATCHLGVANMTTYLDRDNARWIMIHIDGCWDSINQTPTGMRIRTAPLRVQ